MKLIGIGGELESGKSTVANVVVSEYGYTEKSFAKNLKDMCKEVFGLTDHQVNHTDGKKELLVNKVYLRRDHIDAIIAWAVNKNGFDVTGEMSAKIVSYIGKELITSRMILQFVGTEILRESIVDDYHIQVVLKEIQDEGLNDVVISDARFRNEREWIKSLGGATILAYNPHAKKVVSSHASEKVGDPDDYDFTIVNDKNIGMKQLNKAVHQIALVLELDNAKANLLNTLGV
jgi:hypothetical protein